MFPARWVCSVLVLLLAFEEARAQIVVSYPWWTGSPASFYTGGIGFNHFGRRLAVRGFAGGGIVAPAFNNGVFVSPGPFYGSFFPPGPWGIIDNRITVNVITPPAVTVSPRRLQALLENLDNDVSGVDLDVVGPEALEGKPARPRVPLRPAPEPARPAPKPAKAPPPEKPKEAPKPPKVEVPPQQNLPPPKDDPKEESERLLRLGREAFQGQFYGLAAFRFAQAVKANPLDGSPYFLLSQAEFALGKYRDAVRAIEAGMKMQPRWQSMPFDRFDLYKNIEADLDSHIKRLETAVAREPKNADYLFLLAHVYWFAGQRDRAVILFRQARMVVADPAFIDRFLIEAMPGAIAANGSP